MESTRLSTVSMRFLALGLLATGCATAPRPAPEAATPPPAPTPAPSQVSRSSDGMVVTSSPWATRAGVSMLERGGNAVDAAVAAAFTLAVVEPSMSGIGGRTQILLRAPDGELYGVDGTTQVPAGYPVDEVGDQTLSSGYGMIGVPGVVAGLTKVLQEHGSLPLPVVMAPAIRLAEEGIQMNPGEAARIAGTARFLAQYEGSRQYFLPPNGEAFGSRKFIQRDLAKTLRAIAEGGADAFYRGDIARRIVEDVQANGGYIRMSDLAGYEAKSSRVMRGSYRGYGLAGTWFPASGATTIEILQILEHFDLSSMSEGEWAATVAEALRLGYEDRIPAWTTGGGMTPEKLVSKEWAAERARQIGSQSRPSDSRSIQEARPWGWQFFEEGHTTHLSTADARGGAVALTQSNGPSMGSRVASPGLGFVYAATMGYLGRTAPGHRAPSSISPFMVLRDGKPVYVLGAAGARRIVTSIVEAVSRAIDQGLSLDRSVSAARVHPDGDSVVVEVGPGRSWRPAELDAIRAAGLDIGTRSSGAYFGRIHGIFVDPETGEFIGVADPRWDGSAAGPASIMGRGEGRTN